MRSADARFVTQIACTEAVRADPIFGGFVMGLGWWLAGLLCAITIVGLPWAKSCFVIGKFAFLPL